MTDVTRGTSADSSRQPRTLSLLDRALYALFARHADESRHARDRRHYRETDLHTSFDVYLSRIYALSWIAFAFDVEVHKTRVVEPILINRLSRSFFDCDDVQGSFVRQQ